MLSVFFLVVVFSNEKVSLLDNSNLGTRYCERHDGNVLSESGITFLWVLTDM
jgi:hypothetical protein